MKWSLEQQRRYRTQVKALGLDDDARRDLLQSLTGKRSTSELDRSAMARVIEAQAAMMGQPKPTQDDKIRGLEKALGWHGQPARLAGFIRRQTRGRKHDLSQLTPREKSALIEGLKGVIASIRRKRKQARKEGSASRSAR